MNTSRTKLEQEIFDTKIDVIMMDYDAKKLSEVLSHLLLRIESARKRINNIERLNSERSNQDRTGASRDCATGKASGDCEMGGGQS